MLKYVCYLLPSCIFLCVCWTIYKKNSLVFLLSPASILNFMRAKNNNRVVKVNAARGQAAKEDRFTGWSPEGLGSAAFHEGFSWGKHEKPFITQFTGADNITHTSTETNVHTVLDRCERADQLLFPQAQKALSLTAEAVCIWVTVLNKRAESRCEVCFNCMDGEG